MRMKKAMAQAPPDSPINQVFCYSEVLDMYEIHRFDQEKFRCLPRSVFSGLFSTLQRRVPGTCVKRMNKDEYVFMWLLLVIYVVMIAGETMILSLTDTWSFLWPLHAVFCTAFVVTILFFVIRYCNVVNNTWEQRVRGIVDTIDSWNRDIFLPRGLQMFIGEETAYLELRIVDDGQVKKAAQLVSAYGTDQ